MAAARRCRRSCRPLLGSLPVAVAPVSSRTSASGAGRNSTWTRRAPRRRSAARAAAPSTSRVTASVAGRADPAGEASRRRASGPRPGAGGAPPVPRPGERAVDPRRGDLERVGAADQVLVAGPARRTRRGTAARCRPGRRPASESTTTRHGVPAAGGAHVELVELEPGRGDQRLQHAAQLPGRPEPGSGRGEDIAGSCSSVAVGGGPSGYRRRAAGDWARSGVARRSPGPSGRLPPGPRGRPGTARPGERLAGRSLAGCRAWHGPDAPVRDRPPPGAGRLRCSPARAGRVRPGPRDRPDRPIRCSRWPTRPARTPRWPPRRSPPTPELAGGSGRWSTRGPRTPRRWTPRSPGSSGRARRPAAPRHRHRDGGRGPAGPGRACRAVLGARGRRGRRWSCRSSGSGWSPSIAACCATYAAVLA